MRSYVDDRWLVSSASQIIRMNAYERCLPDDWEWCYVLPREELMDSRWEDAFSFDDGRRQIVYAHWMNDVRKNRFFLPYREIENAISNFKPDVIVCETPEHVLAIRHMCSTLGVRPRVVSFIVHVEGKPPTWRRQLEGFVESDVAAFQNERERAMWFTMVGDDLPARYHDRATIWKGMFTPEESWGYELASKIIQRVENKPLMFFISRLSDPNRTRWPEFVAACEILHADGVSFDVMYANPNEAMPWEKVRQLPNYVEHPFGERTLTREQYFAILRIADVVPILYANKSGGLCEAAINGCHIVTVAESGLHYVHVDPTDPSSIADGLLWTFEHADYVTLNTQSDYVMDEHSAERNIEPVRDALEGVHA